MIHSDVCLWTGRRTTEPRTRQRAEEIVAKLRQVDVLTSQGNAAADATRAIGIAEVTHYRRRQEFGALKSDPAKLLTDLETENARLRRAVSHLTLAKMILAEPARGNFQAPRAVVPALITSDPT